MIFQGIRTSIAKNPMFCDFSGGGGPDPLSSGSAHVLAFLKVLQINLLYEEINIIAVLSPEYYNAFLKLRNT